MAFDSTQGSAEHASMGSKNELLSSAEELVGKGEYRAAIDMLADGGSFDDPAVAQRLVDLRIDAYGQMQWPQPHDNWPPAHDNRFVDVEGFPEVQFEDLTVEDLKAGILGKGGLIVRGIMKPERAAAMRENIDRTLEARRAQSLDEPGAEGNPWHQRSSSIKGGPAQFRGGTRYTNVGSAWVLDSPPSAFQALEYFREIKLRELLASYFGEDPVLSVRKWVGRCAAPNNGGIAGWHQDGQFLGDAMAIRTANLWIALTDCGGDAEAPGIEIIGGTEREILEVGTRGAPFEWTVGPELVDEIAQENPVQCPRFNEGDAIFFDHFNLHRTGFGHNHTKNRYALESWFFASSTAPMKQQPVVF
jgi:hypothetical protein